MLSIGEFSKICEVSTKTLRYYAEIGLISPDEVNPENGYRYYSIRQLKKMLLISRLKAYQFSLEEIKAVLEQGDARAEEALASALRQKRREILEKKSSLEATLQQMECDLADLEKGIPMMSYLDQIAVELVETPPMNLLFERRMMSSDDFAAGSGKFFWKLYQRIVAGKLTVTGAPMTFYHSPEYDPAGNDTEFAIPIREAVKGTRDFPGCLCAKSVLHGPYTGLTAVYARMREWMEGEGFEVTGPLFEVYLTDPNQIQSTDDLVTEVYFPVRKK